MKDSSKFYFYHKKGYNSNNPSESMNKKIK